MSTTTEGSVTLTWNQEQIESETIRLREADKAFTKWMIREGYSVSGPKAAEAYELINIWTSAERASNWQGWHRGYEAGSRHA